MKKVSLEKKAGVEQCCKQATQKDTQLSRFNGSYPPVAGLSAHRLPRRTIANSPTSLQLFFSFLFIFLGFGFEPVGAAVLANSACFMYVY